MKLGFICVNVPGHLNPMTTLARQLQGRNHEVIFLYSSEAAGLPVFSEEQESVGQESTNQAAVDVSKLQPEEAVHFYVKTMVRFSESIWKSLETTVAKTGVEALLIDPAYLYAELGAIQLGIPYIDVANAMYNDYSGLTPFCFYGWPHEETAEAMARNQAGVTRFAGILETYRSGLESYARSVGLKVDWSDLSSILSPLAWITQVPRAFDFESSRWPDRLYHTGPFHDNIGRTEVDFPWERLTGEPLVYASMGTIMNNNLPVFQTIVSALAKHKECQLVLSVGNQIDPQQIVSPPKNTIIVQRAPQIELLKQAAVCITHAGLNTVLESLAQGVPQIAIPVTFDQPGIAARIAQKQTGVVTSVDRLDTDHLSELLDEVMTNSTYRANAQKVRQQIATANGLSVAADLVQKALSGVGNGIAG
jgi:zeaxanthin glucosyltransferase